MVFIKRSIYLFNFERVRAKSNVNVQSVTFCSKENEFYYVSEKSFNIFLMNNVKTIHYTIEGQRDGRGTANWTRGVRERRDEKGQHLEDVRTA